MLSIIQVSFSHTPKSYQQISLFRECQRILNSHSWDERDQGIKAQFEAGTRTAAGIFNLMLSALPSKVMRLLEVIGFSGSKVSVFKDEFICGYVNQQK